MSTIGLQKSKPQVDAYVKRTEIGFHETQAQIGAPHVLDAPKMVKRDRIAILLQMLDIACVATKKTHLMYGGGINYYQLERHLGLLLQLAMIEEIKLDDGTMAFRTTDKGRMFCQLFNYQDVNGVRP